MSNTFKYVILSRVMNMAFDGIVLSRVTELLNETIVTGLFQNYIRYRNTNY